MLWRPPHPNIGGKPLLGDAMIRAPIHHSPFARRPHSHLPASRQPKIMNRIEKFLGLRGEAKLRLLDGDFEVVAPGDFVRCSVTGQQIALADVKYWNVAEQEVYASAAIAMQRHIELLERRGATPQAAKKR